MDDTADRQRLGDHPRSAVETEWELFAREGPGDPLDHVGSVTAPTVEVAADQAERLFGTMATDLWICPADAVTRYATRSVEDSESSATPSEEAGGA